MSWVLYEDDCFNVFPSIEDKSVDMILCDLPYGTTELKWDTPLPLDELWLEYKRVIKDNGAIVLTASQPFTSFLIMSNPDMYRYSWVWEKSKATQFLTAKLMPMKKHEDITIFTKYPINHSVKIKSIYNPQGLLRVDKPLVLKHRKKSSCVSGRGNSEGKKIIKEFTNYPTSIIKFNNEGKTHHPTQKPVKLFEYLIKTYTNEHDLVLDNCAGSGTTGVACQNLNRDCILIEKEHNYCDIIRERMATVEDLQAEYDNEQTLLDYATAK